MFLHQDHVESFRTFATLDRSKAKICNCTTVSECEFGKRNVTSYTEEALTDVMLAGVGDDGTRRDVFRTEDILSRSFYEIISLI